MNDALTPDSVASFLQDDTANREDTLRQNILTASDTNPDAHAEAVKLGRTTNTPPEFVAADIETYRKSQKVDPELVSRIVSNYPAFDDWLGKQDNAKIAHDDVGALTGVLDVVRAFPSGAGQAIGQAISGIGAISKSADSLVKKYDKMSYPSLGFNENILKFYLKTTGFAAPIVGQGVKDASEAIGPPEERQNTATNISSGIGQVGAQVLAYWLSGGTASGVMMFGQGADQQTERLNAAGETSPETRFASQALGGITTYATERVELGVLLKGVPGLDKVMGKLPAALQKKWAKKVIDVTAAGGAEAAQETIEGFLQDTIEYAIYNPDVEFLKGMQQQAGEAGAVGAISRALILGISSARGGRSGAQEINNQAAAKDELLNAKTQVQETNLQARDPEKMREVLKTGNEEGKRITLDGTVVQQFFQSGIDPEDFFNLAPSAREQFEQADAAGTDVSIPLDEFLHAMATAPDNAYDFMADFVKIDPDVDPALQGWDMEDPEQVNAFIQQSVRQAQEEWGSKFEQAQDLTLGERIERQIRDNLMNSELMGEKVRTPEAAASEAALYGAFANTLTKTSEDAAMRVFEKRFGTNFQVEGYKPPLPRKFGTGSAYYDQIRSKVKARRAADKAKDQRASKKTGLFGLTKPKRDAATPTPLINYLIDRGGIARGSVIASELDAIGITTKSHPRLYRKPQKGFGYKNSPLEDIDGFPVEDVEQALGTSGIFSRDADNNGYVDRNELLDFLRNESHGDYIRSDDQLAKENLDEAEQQFLDALNEEGVDIETATAAEIESAIERAKARHREDYETNQPGGYYQSERGVTLFSDRGQTVIKLFEGSDQSTLLHETGHVFLDIFQEIASQPDASAEIKADFQNTLNWLGVTSADQIQTDQHEQFARGFEAYLFKGESPSASLKGTFDRFKIWLANLYSSIKQLGVNVSPEMTAVFDRLLATNAEIEALRSNPVFAPEQATLEMLSPAQREDYLKRKADAMRRAKDKLFRKAIRQARRKNTEWWKEQSDSVQAQVEEELKAQPVYQATLHLQENAEKLNESQVVAAFDSATPNNPLGKHELKYLPRGVRAKDGTLDPSIVADMFGFGSALKMLQAMKQVDPYKQAVARMTEDRMIARHGDMLNDGTIEAEALAMVMQEDTDAAQVELLALAERTGAAYPSDGDFQKAAAIALGSLSVDQAVKPERYYRAALKATREYGKALQAKQYDDKVVNGKDGKQSVVKGAAAWKRQEILNKHLYKLSKAAREETERALRKFKELDKQPAKGSAKSIKIDPDYHQKIWDILDKYNLNPRITDAKRLKLELSALNQWIQAQETDEGASLMMPPELLAADSKQHYRDLTMNEFRGLRDLVLNLETQGRNKRKYIIAGQERELQELVTELLATAEQHNQSRDVALSERRARRKLGKKFGNIINGIDAVNTKTAQMMAVLDGGYNLGIWTRTIYEPMQAAEIQKNVRNRTELRKWKAILDKWYADEPRGFLDRDVMNTGGQKVALEEMLSIALHQGTEDNQAKLIDGYQKSRGWDEDFIDRILGNMREKDWLFVQETWDYLDSFWPETSQIEKNRFGYAPEKLEAQPLEVTTSDGKFLNLRGGYMRIMYDGEQDVSAGNNELAQTFQELQIGKGARAQTRRGSQIERVSGVKKPIRLDLDVLSEHISEQVGIITMSETVENINKVIRKNDIQQAMQDFLGKDAKEMVDLWLKDVAVGGALSGGTINSALRAIRSNYTVGRLGLKPVTAFLQFSGLAHTTVDFGTVATLRNFGKLFKRGNPYIVSQEIMQKSVFMQERAFSLNRDIADALGQYTAKGDNIKQKVSAMLLYPMQKTQELVDSTTWLAGYEKATGEGLDEADAVRAADIAVARLQSSGLTSDLAAIERGTLNTSTQRQELVKASTMFFSYFNAKYNLVKNQQIKFNNKEISGVDLAMSYLMAFLVEGIISSSIMGQIDWDDDDDGELSAPEVVFGIAGTTMMNMASTVPFVRTVSSGIDGFGGETAAAGQLAGLGQFINTTMGIVEKLKDGETERINPYSATRQAVDALNTFLPLPAATINQFIRGLEKEDETGEAGLMDYLVYQKE